MNTNSIQWPTEPDRIIDISDASLAVRQFGYGPDLLFIHGFATSGFTWRYLLAELSKQYTCWVVDLPGFGDARWDLKTDFSFTAQASRLAGLLDALNISKFGLIAHDTGATIARLLALNVTTKLESLCIINTEIPGHRPPWIPLYQRLAVLPGTALVFQFLLGLSVYRRSSMGLGGFFVDQDQLEGEFHRVHIQPLLDSQQKMQGLVNYLRGIEWNVVDEMAYRHADIQAETLAIWGVQDPTFPVDRAKSMIPQFRKPLQFSEISNASLLPHEEQPRLVLDALLPFLNRTMSST
ncbi:MAG: alpha/beta fold hydrolase [Oceanococcus sp.]